MARTREALAALGRQSRSRQLWRSLGRAGLDAERDRLVPPHYFLDLYPEADQLTVPVGDVLLDPSSLDPYEVSVLSAIALVRRPGLVFEIGTYDGVTSHRLARLLPEARIVTLDLPAEESEVGQLSKGRSAAPGRRFAGTPEAARIEQRLGDSRTFDYSPWHGRVDLVVVDAGHTWDCVSADTESALRLLSPTGVVVWDDYCDNWPDVVRAVTGLAASGRARPVTVRGTELAVWDRRLIPPT